MRSFIAAFVIATVVAAILTPLVRLFALRLNVVPGIGRRDVHTRKIPRLGGLAICVAVFAPIVGLFFVESAVAELFRAEVRKVVGLCVGGIVMCAVGVLDDTRGMRALHKLYVQIVVAIMAYYIGFRIDAVFLPLFGHLSMGVFALPVSVLWIVGITNAVNLIDGLDGLAGGVVFFAGVTNLVVAIMVGAGFSALIMAALLGAVLGFLFYNFNPARIFMGDSGSYLLGYVLAATALVGDTSKGTTAVALLVPVVALGVPIFDTLFAMVRRFLERRPIFSPDRGHLHHRLLDMGLTHRRAVLLIYGISIVFTVASIGIYLGRSWQLGVALLTASAVVVGLVRFVGNISYSHFRRREQARLRSRDTEVLRFVVPEGIARLQSAESEQEIFDELVWVAEQADLAAFEIRSIDDVDAVPHFGWSDRKSELRRVVATRIYPLGHDAVARAALRVSTINDYEDDQMLPASDILLQLIADAAALAFERVSSELGPRVSLMPQSAPDSSRRSKPRANIAPPPSAPVLPDSERPNIDGADDPAVKLH